MRKHMNTEEEGFYTFRKKQLSFCLSYLHVHNSGCGCFTNSSITLTDCLYADGNIVSVWISMSPLADIKQHMHAVLHFCIINGFCNR